MKKIFRYLTYTALMSLFAVGCVQDNGNYDYVELPQMNAESFQLIKNGEEAAIYDENTIVVVKDDVLKLAPYYDIDNSISPNYLWTIYNKDVEADEDNFYPSPDTLSKEAILDYTIVEAPGDYVITLTINSNVDSRYKTIIPFNMKVSPVTGMYVLYADASGNGDINVVRTGVMDEVLDFSDYIVDANLLTKKNNGRGVMNPTVMNINYANSRLIAGSAEFNTYDADMVLTSDDYSALFREGYVPTAPFNVQYYGSLIAGGTTKFEYMVIDNKLFGHSANYMGAFTGFSTANDYTYFEKVLFYGAEFDGHLAYNETKQGFEWLTTGFGYDFYGIRGGAAPDTIYNAGGSIAMGATGLDIIDFGRSNESNVAAIMTDGSVIKCVRFSQPAENSEDLPAATMLTEVDITSAPDIANAKVWEFGTRGDYAFYGVGNKLYVLNTVSGSVIEAEGAIPADETITHIELFRDSDNLTYDTSVIYVATLKGVAEGSVHQFAIRQLSGRVEVETKASITGFGKIADMYYVK